MNRQGLWDWKILLALVMGGLLAGLAIGQTHGVSTTRIGVTDGGYIFWSMDDPKHQVLCYALVPEERIGPHSEGAAISCVKIEGGK